MPFAARSQQDLEPSDGSGVHRIGTVPRDVVLLVEPDAAVRTGLVEALVTRFHVRDAPDAMTAARLLGDRETPRAMVVSAALPFIDGPTFVCRMRSHAQFARVPVVFLTSPKDSRLLVRAIGAGARACLEMPVLPAKLCSLLVRILGLPAEA